jgi:hypothetical protein
MIWRKFAQIKTGRANMEDALRFFDTAAQFKSSESGVVTTDWLFMCFGVVALGAIVIGAVYGSQITVAEQISSGLVATGSN